jgi:hypothetical protein
MTRRMLLPLAAAALLLGGVPALADANGSTETTTETRSCSAPSDNQVSAPGPNDCKKADGSPNPGGTYQATRWTNDVKCGDRNSPTPANPSGIRLYASGDQAAQRGAISMCSDGSGAAPAPVQGRAGASAGTADGVKVLIDGDKENPAPNNNETAKGYAVVQAGPQPGAPTVTCGDEFSQGGRADSDSVQARDNQAECGG